MNSLEILKVLLLIPRHSVGVFPADRIVQKWSKPCAFVFNTDDQTKIGTHWVAIYVDDNSRGWYFDSYGQPPLNRHHLRVIRKNCKQLRWNTTQLQSLESANCGHFCVMFLHYLSSFKTMRHFLEIFSADLQENDRISARFVKKICGKFKNSKQLHVGRGEFRRLYPCQKSFCQQDFQYPLHENDTMLEDDR